jgi:hypothetical protein
VTINAQAKGKTGEREICDLLRVESMRCFQENAWIEQGDRDRIFASIQRNQNQSAVGGHDIGFMGLSIEVKRCETLSVPQWWRQCVVSAGAAQARPVLIYRQNRKAWRVKMETMLPIDRGSSSIWCTAEFEIDQFEIWLRLYIAAEVRAGRVP